LAAKKADTAVVKRISNNAKSPPPNIAFDDPGGNNVWSLHEDDVICDPILLSPNSSRDVIKVLIRRDNGWGEVQHVHKHFVGYDTLGAVRKPGVKVIALSSSDDADLSLLDLEKLMTEQCRTVFPHGLNDRVGCVDYVAAFPHANATSLYLESNKYHKNVKNRVRGKRSNLLLPLSVDDKADAIVKEIKAACHPNSSNKDIYHNLPSTIRHLAFNADKNALRIATEDPSLRNFLDSLDPIFWMQLKDVLMYKLGLGASNKAAHRARYADNGVVFHFPDPGMEMLLLEQVLKDNPPPHLINKKLDKRAKPKVMWHYCEPVRKEIHNYTRFMRHEFDDVPDHCCCHLIPDHYKRKLNKNSDEHVVTGDFSVLFHLWQAEHGEASPQLIRTLKNLVSLLEKGPNFRLCNPDLDDVERLGPELTNCVESGLDSFIKKTVRKLNKEAQSKKEWTPEDFDSWRSSFLESALARLDDVILKETSSPSIDRICYNKELKLMRKFVHKAFVCTYADKCAGNNVLICKKAYHEHISSIVNNEDMYELVEGELTDIIAKIKDKIADLTEDGRGVDFDLVFGEILPIIHLIPKLHKVGSRIICSNTASTVTGPISRQVSGALKAIFNGARKFERAKGTKIEGSKKHWASKTDCWFTCENTQEVVETLNRLENQIKHIESIDFTSLYDFISHDEVDRTMKDIVPKVYGKRKYLEVPKFNPKKPNHDAEWRSNLDDEKLSIDRKMLCSLISELNSCFFVCGSKIFKQKRGTAMGLSPAPFMANLVLYGQERVWANQFLKKGMTILRFLDDVLGINAKISELGVDIYRDPLKYTEDPAIPSRFDPNIRNLHFLDLDIQVNVETGQSSWSTYDKRSDYGFKINKMPRRDSNIHSCTLRSVIIGQCLRTVLTNKKLSDFKKNASLVLSDAVANRWPKAKVFENFLAFVRKLPHAQTTKWQCDKKDLKAWAADFCDRLRY
jgi:hypothetical protein